MNPYLLTAIVMCLIVLLSLAATAYVAVMFNRRAKHDLEVALTPLAELVQGDLDLEEAQVKGRYGGNIVAGRMANAAFGPGREFQADLIDAAGGVAWQLILSPARTPGDPPERRFETADPELEERLGAGEPGWQGVLAQLPTWSRLTYDPAAGQIRLAWPMRTRRDLPDVETFRRQLELLVAVGMANRRAQGAPLPEAPQSWG